MKWLDNYFFPRADLHRWTQIDTAQEAKLANQPEPEITILGETKPASQPSPQLEKRVCVNHLCHFKLQCLGCREGTKDHAGTFRMRLRGESDSTGEVIRVCKTAQLLVNTFGYDEYAAQIAKKGRSRNHPPSLSSTPPHKKTKTIQTK